MQDWFKTLSDKELKIWLKNIDTPFNHFMSNEDINNNILLAKEELKNRGL